MNRKTAMEATMTAAAAGLPGIGQASSIGSPGDSRGLSTLFMNRAKVQRPAQIRL